MDYFTQGKILENDGQYIHFNISSRHQNNKIIFTTLLPGRDIFAMVDEIALWLKEGLALPQVHIEKTVDLPVAEILTGSVPALKSFYKRIQ